MDLLVLLISLSKNLATFSLHDVILAVGPVIELQTARNTHLDGVSKNRGVCLPPKNGWVYSGKKKKPLKIPWIWGSIGVPLFLVQHPDICAAIHGWLEVPFEQFVGETFRCCKHLPVWAANLCAMFVVKCALDIDPFFFEKTTTRKKPGLTFH